MPKVGTIRFDLKDGPQQFPLFYSRGDNFTVPTFPSIIVRTACDADGISPAIGFTTEQVLIDYYRDRIKRYYEVITTERRIILLRMEVAAAMSMNEEPRTSSGRSYSGHQKWFTKYKDKIGDLRGLEYGLSFEWETGVLISGKEDKFYTTVHNENGEEISRSSYGEKVKQDELCSIIDYSPEAEIFFKGVAKQMTIMAQKMAAFFTDKNKLELAIESKTNLLTYSKKE